MPNLLLVVSRLCTQHLVFHQRHATVADPTTPATCWLFSMSALGDDPAEFERCRYCSSVRDDGARPGRAGAVQRYWATRVPRALPRRNQRFAVPFAGIGTDADNGQRTARVEAVQVRDACARRSRGSTHSVGVQPVPQQLVESFCPAVARWHCITDLCRRADRPGRRGRVPAVRKHVGGPTGDPTRLERCRLQARAHRPDEWPFSAQV
jgi:hypothetical protein